MSPVFLHPHHLHPTSNVSLVCLYLSVRVLHTRPISITPLLLFLPRNPILLDDVLIRPINAISSVAPSLRCAIDLHISIRKQYGTTILKNTFMFILAFFSESLVIFKVLAYNHLHWKGRWHPRQVNSSSMLTALASLGIRKRGANLTLSSLAQASKATY